MGCSGIGYGPSVAEPKRVCSPAQQGYDGQFSFQSQAKPPVFPPGTGALKPAMGSGLFPILLNRTKVKYCKLYSEEFLQSGMPAFQGPGFAGCFGQQIHGQNFTTTCRLLAEIKQGHFCPIKRAFTGNLHQPEQCTLPSLCFFRIPHIPLGKMPRAGSAVTQISR